MPKVTMALSDRDKENATFIETATQARSKAHGLSIALSLARFVIDRIRSGDELMFRKPDGTFERVLLADLENVRAG